MERRMAKLILTQNYVHSLLDYDPETGVLTWLSGRRRGRQAGSIEQGYLRVAIDRKRYMAHRLIWFYMYGTWPDEIDHQNRVRSDNRLVNLRSVNHVENMRNQGLRVTNTSGVTGVHWCRVARKWVAQIKVAGKSRYVGQFKDKRLAIDARERAEQQHGFERIE